MGQITRFKPCRTHQRPSTGLLFCMLLTTGCVLHRPALSAQDPNVPAAYTQALKALEAQDTPTAVQLLQQVITEHPNWAGAWLDLALLASRQGDHAQSEEFLLALESRFAPLPGPIAQAVEQLRQQIKLQRGYPEVQTPHQAVRQHVLALATGYDTNANAGLQFSTLTLNLPDGDTLLNIDPSSRARSAQSLRVAWAHYGRQSWGQDSLTWQIQTQARQYSLSSQNNLELLVQTTLEKNGLPGRFAMGWQHIWLGGRDAYSTPILRWQWDTELGQHCAWQQHVQAESRQHARASYMDTRWQAYRSTWRCLRGAQRSQIMLQLAAESAANPGRPGGNSRHRTWGVQHEWLQPFGLTEHNLLVRLDVLDTQDKATYSPVLDSGRPRSLQRMVAWVNWTAPVPGQAPWRWTVGLNNTQQKSNIQLFRQENYSLETSIWRSW